MISVGVSSVLASATQSQRPMEAKVQRFTRANARTPAAGPTHHSPFIGLCWRGFAKYPFWKIDQYSRQPAIASLPDVQSWFAAIAFARVALSIQAATFRENSVT